MLTFLSLSCALAGEVHGVPSLDVPIVVGAGALWAGLYLGEDRQPVSDARPYAPPGGIDAWALDHYVARWDHVADAGLYGGIALGLVATPFTGTGARAPDRVLLYAEALMVDGALVELTKQAVRRPRPYTATEPTGEPDATLSFPSGHTAWTATVAFSTVRTLDLARDLAPGARVAAYGGAAALTLGMGVLRVDAGVHHPSDVLVGAAIGGAVGWLVPELHRSERLSITAAPLPGGGARVSMSGGWR